MIGGLMVQLHAIEHGETQRPTEDIDVLADARGRKSMTQRVAKILDDLRATVVDSSLIHPKTGFRFTLEDGHMVDVLGPDGLKNPPKTIANRETFGIPGGTQALRRTEKITVSLEGGEQTIIRRPSLLGAILIKARSIMDRSSRREEKIESDRRDLVLLLSLVEVPRAMKDETRNSERKWLRNAHVRLQIDRPDLEQAFAAEALANARAAYAILTE
ncbi:MAG: hypothetical protein WBQ41_04535 [Solirubrobacterales bacterium]